MTALVPSRNQEFWPGDDLVPLLQFARTQLLPPMEDKSAFDHVSLQLEQLPYCLGALSYAYLEFVATLHATVIFDIAKTPSPSGIHVLRPEERDRVCFLIDSFLEAGRRSQNALIPYVSKAYGVSLPSSLHDLERKVRAGKVALPEALASLIIQYWSSHGERLKQYRDLSQHHALVSSDARTFVANAAPCVYLVLPNNPEAKSASKLQFVEPFVHAQAFLKDQFFSLLQLCNDVVGQFIDKQRMGRVLIGQNLKGPLIAGRQQGVAVTSVPAVTAALKQHLPRLRPPRGLSDSR